MKEDETRTPFAKGEPRASWDSYKDDFAEVLEEDGGVEPAGDDAEGAEVKPADDEDGGVEPADDDEVDGGIAPSGDEDDEVDGGIAPIGDDEDDVQVDIEPPVQTVPTKIYINGELLGSCDDPVSFTQEMREKIPKIFFLVFLKFLEKKTFFFCCPKIVG